MPTLPEFFKLACIIPPSCLILTFEKKVIRAEVIEKKKIALTRAYFLFKFVLNPPPPTPTAPHGKKNEIGLDPLTPQSDPPRP